MRSWTDRFRDGGGTGAGEVAGYFVELSFRISDGDSIDQRRRRLLLVTEALKDIASREDRLRAWELVPGSDPKWVLIRAVVEAAQPGHVAELSEAWMRSAIAAANLAASPEAAVVPSQRSAGWAAMAMPSITAQVLADV